MKKKEKQERKSWTIPQFSVEMRLQLGARAKLRQITLGELLEEVVGAWLNKKTQQEEIT